MGYAIKPGDWDIFALPLEFAPVSNQRPQSRWELELATRLVVLMAGDTHIAAYPDTCVLPQESLKRVRLWAE